MVIMFERKNQDLIPLNLFLVRMLKHAAIAGLIVTLSLAIGMIGYHLTANLSWLDSFLNASMILTGMGPVAILEAPSAKIFAGCYALYSGITFLTAISILLSPLAHRVLHKFHLDDE